METSNSPKTPEIVLLSLADLYVPEWNPRKFIDEAQMQLLMAFIQSGGALDRILVWKGNGRAPYAVISGQRRVEAFRRLGRTQIEAEILDITLEEVKRKARTANEGDPVHWLDRYESWEACWMEHTDWFLEDVAKYFGKIRPMISRAKVLLSILNPEARGLIRQHLDKTNHPVDPNAPLDQNGDAEEPEEDQSRQTLTESLNDLDKIKPKKSKPWRMSEAVVYPLIGLLPEGKDKELAPAQAKAVEAIKVILDRQMTGPQVEKLVAWINSGKDIAQFEPEARGHKSRPKGSTAQEQVLSPATGEGTGSSNVSAAPSTRPPSPKYSFGRIPVSRIRIGKNIPALFSEQAVERKALSMKAYMQAKEIKVRVLSEAEKAADPGHDYELFYEVLTFKGAQKLGWPTLNALIYEEIDEMEALIFNFRESHHSNPLTWVELYGAMEEILKDDPEETLENLAVQFEEDPGEAKQVMRAMKLFNEDTELVIIKNVQAGWGHYDYQFVQELAIPLIRLEAFHSNPFKVQQLVERTVKTAIEHQLHLEDMEELVSLVLEGNEPEECFEKEA